MKTVLAFGASGLVGAAAANFFFRAGSRVITCSRRRPTLLPKKSHEHLRLEITDSASFSEILSSLEEDVSHVV